MSRIIPGPVNFGKQTIPPRVIRRMKASFFDRLPRGYQMFASIYDKQITDELTEYALDTINDPLVQVTVTRLFLAEQVLCADRGELNYLLPLLESLAERENELRQHYNPMGDEKNGQES